VPRKATKDDLDSLLLSRVRLGIMSALAADDELDFAALKEVLKTSDGNLGAHLRKLEDAGMVGVRKRFIGRKPNTSYRMTADGRRAFEGYIDDLAALLGLKGEDRG